MAGTRGATAVTGAGLPNITKKTRADRHGLRRSPKVSSQPDLTGAIWAWMPVTRLFAGDGGTDRLPDRLLYGSIIADRCRSGEYQVSSSVCAFGITIRFDHASSGATMDPDDYGDLVDVSR